LCNSSETPNVKERGKGGKLVKEKLQMIEEREEGFIHLKKNGRKHA